MKNLLKKTLVAFVAAVILSLVPGMSAYCGITNFDYVAAAASGSYVQVEGTAIYAESGYPEEKINGAVSGWTLVPEGVREKLVEYGCTIFLSVTAQSEPDTNTAGIAHCARISRYTDTGEIVGIVELPYIVCLERSSDPEGVVIHEIGHIFDMTIALLGEGVYEDSYYEVSDSEEWQAIYNLYKDQLAGIDNSTKWNMYNSAEGFAECFRLTYQNPEALTAVCPAAYEFVVDVVAKYAP